MDRTAPPRHSHHTPPNPHYQQAQTYTATCPPAAVSVHPIAGQSQLVHSPALDARSQQPYHHHPPPPPPPPTVPPRPQQYPQPASVAHTQNTAAHSYPPHSPYHTAPLPPIQSYPSQPPQFGQEPVSGARPQPQSHEAARDEHPQYSQLNPAGHAAPAPIAQRTYSHDQQHTPLTQVQAGPHPVGPAPESSQKPMEHVMHQGYAHHNGVHHVAPPPPHHAPPQEPPASYANTPVMEHPQYVMQQPSMYHMQGYGPASQQSQYTAASVMSKRKPMRAQQACEQCRQRKQKCDEGTPCSFCKEQNINCTYRDTPPAKTDKNTEKITSILEQMNQRLEQNDSRLHSIESTLRVLLEMKGASPPVTVKAQSAPAQPVDEPESERHAKIAQPKSHRTPPHKLMSLWPTAAALFPPESIPSEYYVTAAENRGVLRLYGRGEGIDDQDGAQLCGPASPASPARSDGGSDNAPTPREGIWGRGFANNHSASTTRPVSLVGGLKADGSLDLDSTTVISLFDSYMTHMHPMHPFLDRTRSRKLIETFVSRHSPDAYNRRSVVLAVAQRDTNMHYRDNEVDRPIKRARTSDSASSNKASAGNSNLPPPPSLPVEGNQPKYSSVTERSPTNAIVWLILALGKICLHKEPLPGVTDIRANTNTVMAHQHTSNAGFIGSSPLNPAVRPSPFSPNSMSTTHPTPPDHGVARSRRSSQDSGSTFATRNIETIPGLAYYAKAAEIMGDQGDGNDLVHAQMFLLAALYKGQLARVRESMSWLTKAGATCQELVESHKLYRPVVHDKEEMMQRITAMTSDKRNHLILMAAWSCLQLESDILAELHLPGSGILSLEDMLILPGGIIDEDEPYKNSSRPGNKTDTYDDEFTTLHYSAQILLRRVLNHMHRELYGEEAKNKSLADLQSLLLSYEKELAQWRSLLRGPLQWHDDDPPASNILVARLRAKYWGAVYVSTRPFLDYCLHVQAQIQQDGTTVEEVALCADGQPREIADVMVLKAIAQMGREKIWDCAQRCINAALRSTVALDGVPQRLIVTNIHGTAHAQFGNMLVLAAAWNTPHVRGLVPEPAFQKSLERTVMFLKRLSPLSPTCDLDARHLEIIQTKLFPVAEEARATYHSGTEPLSATNSFSYG